MNYKSLLKRIISMGMACVMCAMSLYTPIFAADTIGKYYIHFYDTSNQKESENLRIIEGTSINILAKLPPNYSISTTTPFAVHLAGQDGDKSSNFDIKKNTNSDYTLTAKPNSAGGSAQEFTLEAIYTAIVTSGTGTGMGQTVADDGTITENRYVLTANADPGVAITEDSSLKFKADSTEDESGVVAFGNVGSGPQDTTGSFNQYKNGTVTATAFKTDAGGKYTNMSISSTDPNNPKPLKLKVYFEGSAKIAKGTEFVLEFRRQTINSLITTVITEKSAVDETADSVQKNPTYPQATDIGVPYVKLEDNDTLKSIRSSFEVLSTVHRDNVDIDLKWEWKADDDKYKDYVKVHAGNLGRTTFDIEQRPMEDMPGKLLITASRGTVVSTKREIPIVIYGTGEAANLKPTAQITGVPGKPPSENSVATNEYPKTMDVYDGKADYDIYKDAPMGPFKFNATLTFGSGRGQASKAAIRTIAQGGEVEVMIDGSVVPYTLGTDILNLGKSKIIEVVAKKEGQLHFIVDFYNDSGELMKRNGIDKQINIRDKSPNTDARLADMEIGLVGKDKDEQEVINSVFPSGVIKYDFSPDKNEYQITVPNKTEFITMKPRIPAGTNALTDVDFEYDNGNKKVASGSKTEKIALTELLPKTIKATVTAQNGSTNVYTYNVIRDVPDKESRLKSLQAFRTDVPTPPDLIAAFSPDTKDYDISVPYKAKEIELRVDSVSPWIDGMVFNPAPKVAGFWFWKKEVLKFDLKCDYNPDTGEATNNVNLITVEVTAEDGIGKTKYNLRVTRLPPSVDNLASALTVKDNANTVIPFDAGQAFDPLISDYYVHIPYSAKIVNIEATPRHSEAQLISLMAPKAYGAQRKDAVPKRDAPTLFRNIDVSQNMSSPNKDKNAFTYQLTIKAESDIETNPPYNIHFIRNEPDADTRLSGIELVDQNKKPVNSFAFNQEQLEYTINVPYEITRVTLTPKAVSPLAKMECDGIELTPNRPSVTAELIQGQAKDFSITVTAESAGSRTYKLHLMRGMPSAEARLAELTVDSLIMKPKFNPNTLSYEVTIPEKTKGITVKPTAVDPFATITVNGKPVKSGAASGKIVPMEVLTKISIDVIAQDGKTKLSYIINVRDENLIEKSDNADLLGIKVYEGALSPSFKAAILDYEIALKPDARSLDIIPRPSNENAKIEVMQGSKVLEKYGNAYSTAILEDETKFTVNVTSQDGTKTRPYTLIAYRNNEEKAGVYKPISAEMIDFEAPSPIYVDISKYAVVNADVFNTLKTAHPDKSIIFEGNDYSLEIKGADILTLVPNTSQFDFSMSFNGPNNQTIKDLIAALDGRNENASPVIVHFAHHGTLPGAMRLTISLGGFYKNLRMYWNYYNEERNRIDYYGYVTTNAQGAFTVPLTHMSDFPVTVTMVYGSENKVGALGTNKENLGGATTSDKRNPQTAVSGKD